MTDPDLRLDEVLAAARNMTPDEITAAWMAVVSAHGDVVRQLDAVTEGRDPFSAFVVGVLVGRRLAAAGETAAPGTTGPGYIELD